VVWKDLDLDRWIECTVFSFTNGVAMVDGERVMIGLEALMVGIDISSLSNST